jgi:hypothetical protein
MMDTIQTTQTESLFREFKSVPYDVLIIRHESLFVPLYAADVIFACHLGRGKILIILSRSHRKIEKPINQCPTGQCVTMCRTGEKYT